MENLQSVTVSKSFVSRQARYQAVKGVSLSLVKGKMLGLVGASGSGKTTLGRILLGLTSPDQGEVLYQGSDISRFTVAQMRQFRKDVQCIFQDSYSAFDPKQTMGEAIMEPLEIHKIGTPGERKRLTFEFLERVGLSSHFFNCFPSQMSGGQRQRASIARALILSPSVLIADEPVSALDRSIQAGILRLLRHLQEESKLTVLFISHNLHLVNYLCDEVAVMQEGVLVEQGCCAKVFHQPHHVYTRQLLHAASFFNFGE